MLSDTGDEHRAWDMIRTLPPQRKMAVAIFLKVLLPIKTMIARQKNAGRRLQRLWEDAYVWLSEAEQRRMMGFAAQTAAGTTRPFQSRLEETVLNLIADPEL